MHYTQTLAAALIAVCCLYSSPDWAHGRGGHFHGHSGFGFYFGAPFYPFPYYRPYYPYYPPTVITVPVEPPVYIEQSPPPAQPYPAGYWYYCRNPDGYYPYVKTCPDGWQQVEPTPPTNR